MNAFIRSGLVVALAASALLGPAQAASILDTGALLPGATTVTFQLTTPASASFSVFLTTPGGQFAPDAVGLFAEPSFTLLVPKTTNMLSTGATITFKDLATGEYTLAFLTGLSGGTYTMSTSLSASSYSLVAAPVPVPELTGMSLALGGLGVLGFVGWRRGRHHHRLQA